MSDNYPSKKEDLVLNLILTLRQLTCIAVPLMICSLSGMLMLFFNRLLLANYSLEDHNAAVEATNLGWAFIAGWTSLVSVVQVFVSQHFGAKQYQDLGRFVWQMIWLSLFSSFFFIPAALWAPRIFFDHSANIQQKYLYWMLLFGPLHVLYTALSCFFVGQQKVKLVIFVDVVGNVLNCSLCYLFVFGTPYSAPLGAIGAIFSTNLSVIFQVILLGIIYLQPYNLLCCGTKYWQLDCSLIFQCMRIGFPNALFGMLEFAGWSAFYMMMASSSEKHLTITGIIQSVLILVSFLGEGLARAVCISCGCAIGKKDIKSIHHYVYGGMILMTFCAFCLAVALWIMQDSIAKWFLSSLDQQQYNHLYPILTFGLLNVVIYKLLEGIRLVFSNVLVAATDTFFLLITGALSIWALLVLPTYHFVLHLNGTVELALMICTGYMFVGMCVYGGRFYSNRWMKNVTLHPLCNALKQNH